MLSSVLTTEFALEGGSREGGGRGGRWPATAGRRHRL